MKRPDQATVDAAPADAADQPPDTRHGLRETYGDIAAGRLAKAPICCGSADAIDAPASTCAEGNTRRIPSSTKDLSLACGNPVGLAKLRPGQTVLDLGSGGGLDCFLAAEQVGESGFVIGIDMTPEMLERARAAQRQMGTRNVEFRLGEIEHLPVADGTVDVVLSNCVINLAPDKVQVFREAYRALRPGGLLVVSDVMIGAPLPEALRAAFGQLSASLCVERDYLAAIEAAGFEDVEVVRRVSAQPPQEEIAGASPETPRGARVVVRIGDTGETCTVDVDPASLAGFTTGSFSATVEARKPL